MNKTITMEIDSEFLNKIIAESLTELCIDEAQSMLGDDYLYYYLMTLNEYLIPGEIDKILEKINDVLNSEEFKNEFEKEEYHTQHVSLAKKALSKFLLEHYGREE